MFDMQKIGERMCAERTRLGFTQSDVLNKVGMTQSSLSRYEQGKRVPTLEALTSLHHIGYDVMYLVTGIHGDGENQNGNDTLTPEQTEWLSLYNNSRDTGTLFKLVKAFESMES